MVEKFTEKSGGSRVWPDVCLLSPVHFSRKQIIAGASLLVVAAAGGVYWSTSSRQPVKPPAIADVAPKELLAEIAKLGEGQPQTGAAATVAGLKTEGGKIKLTGASYRGNGMDKMRLAAKNAGSTPLRIEVRPGDIFEDGKNTVVVLRGAIVVIPPGQAVEEDLQTAALRSENVSGESAFVKSSTAVPKLDPLLGYLQSHPGVPPNVVQAAVLVLGEDAPVDVFAKFPRLQQPGIRHPNSEAFKTSTADLIATLQILREIGITQTALNADAQLKIEAMMDPRAHEIAMRYYGIGEGEEWAYWKHELAEGEPSTRHYALYGIARFHPEVALLMMPKWAREKRTAHIYRLAAVGALALTHRPEAESILKKLQQEFDQEPDVQQSADQALRYLEENISKPL